MTLVPFVRPRGGDEIRVRLDADERGLLTDLVGQLVSLLENGDEGDPALARLLPAAYRDDAEAAAEFRRFTADDLTRRKIENGRAVLATLAEPGTGLDRAAQQSWLRTLNDLRLTLGERLGVTGEGVPPSDDRQRQAMSHVFDWLGYLQEALLRSLPKG
ncbi:DUF2017 domain-containing protein [Frigoribacterium sp. VKM Ac-2836]|uniref:DUF2017 domain-containing protein n=1 Tax=Frigoribacterium sp. VKM Ac-2836 TaxID=2739014 RepID=UPI0015644831|nr:DUF2017 domain-containing protein [Frigoribacterium sp. VKM Ac-2836]NRD26824.1 DUF2017 domain-containing protein [Frigoribacterium sp. VKM Ac-2836]